MKKVALILSGCGVYDGAEIQEACAALLALHRAGAEVTACAPSGDQMHVINHLAGEPAAGESRNILMESARIVRGEIKPLADLDPVDFDCVVLPGGFGAAKNLCNFATEGDRCTVHPEVESFLREANNVGKPIGAMCIAPVILARVFGADLHPDLTIGTDPATAGMVENMGANHVDCEAAETVVDEANLMVTTPAYMLAGDIGTVFAGAAGFVEKLLRLCR
ncbi:isoprenoid biosynthesis protein ElbB [bacterium DOLZORAL124_64_63]|nr:MAG: isoprenoid biosynthesis protein ElbB [bacterium DOLZORAL124_64_63]